MIRRKGMTLIEILMTVAILGLIIAVLILLLDPGDDRRCRLEAERFAAWLIGAESEAVMRDGPVRAAVDFSAQESVRELSQMGADITAQAWQLDEKADKFKVKKPVKLTTVDTPIAGELTDGQAWILFNGPRTVGAVTVFQLNEAVYSVVVPPRGAGEIEVKKGRAGLPEPPEFQRAPASLPSLATGLGLGGDGLGAMPVPPRPGTPAEPRAPTDPPLDLDAGVPPSDPDDGVPPPPVDAGVGTEPPPQAFDYGGVPDAAPDAAVAECETDLECKESHGQWGLCFRPPANPADAHCVVDIQHKSFRLRSVSVHRPDAINELLQASLRQMIAEYRFNLMVTFGRSTTGIPGVENNHWAYIYQGLGTGMVFAPHPELPAFESVGQPGETCAPGYEVCQTVVSTAAGASGQAGRVDLYIPRPGSIEQGECAYRKLTVVARLAVNLRPEVAGGGAGDAAFFTLTSYIGRREARALELYIGGEATTLLEVLDDAGAAPDYDYNGDGVADSWQFIFDGPAQEVQHTGTPAAFADRVPPGCD